MAQIRVDTSCLLSVRLVYFSTFCLLQPVHPELRQDSRSLHAYFFLASTLAVMSARAWRHIRACSFEHAGRDCTCKPYTASDIEKRSHRGHRRCRRRVAIEKDAAYERRLASLRLPNTFPLQKAAYFFLVLSLQSPRRSFE